MLEERDAMIDGVERTRSRVRLLALDGTDPAKGPTVHGYLDLVNPIPEGDGHLDEANAHLP